MMGTEPSGWVSFVVSGDAAALDSQHHHRVTLVPVPVSRMAALPNPKQAGFLQHHAAERNPVISRLIAGVSADRLRATVEQLSSYHTRLATSATGITILLALAHLCLTCVVVVVVVIANSVGG